MTEITVPILQPTDMVVEAAVLGLICVAFWWRAVPQLVGLLLPSETDAAAGPSTDPWQGLLALGISAPIAYYLLWLLTTPPTVISPTGVTGGAGPPYYTPTTIHWNDVTTLRCTYSFWRRPRPRFALSIQSKSERIWIGRMSRFQADKLMEVMQPHVSNRAVEACPEWTNFP